MTQADNPERTCRQPRQHAWRPRLARLVFGCAIAAWVTLVVLGHWYGQPTIGRDAKFASSRTIPIWTQVAGVDRHFRAEINSWPGRDGNVSGLRIYPCSDAAEAAMTRRSDPYTTPVEIIADPGIDVSALVHGSSFYTGAAGGVRQVTVAEREVFNYRSACLAPAQLVVAGPNAPLQTADSYEPEFFVYQGERCNTRAFPIEPGTYAVVCDAKDGQWRLVRYSGWRAVLAVDWQRWAIEAAVLMIAWIAGMVGGVFGAVTGGRLILHGLVLAVLAWVALPFEWLVPAATAVLVLAIVCWSRHRPRTG